MYAISRQVNIFIYGHLGELVGPYFPISNLAALSLDAGKEHAE